MPLDALPVTADELQDLQLGTTFRTNAAQATSQAALINADNGVDTVASYAAALLAANIATSQVAMAATCLMWGETQGIDFLTNTATVAAPDFVALAAQIGTNAVSTSAEGVGVALADDPQFAPFLALSATDFAAAVGVATGVNVGVINGWVAFWTGFATDNPSVLQPGVTVQEFAYGATFGDAIGVALQNPTTANLQTTVETNAQGELIIGGDIANALLTIATGQYEVGIDCALLPQHDPLQGEAGAVPVTELILTPLVDSPTEGFSTGNGGEFTEPGGTFIALPAANPPLGTTNTLNAGDDLESVVGADGVGATLELTTIESSFFGANDPFAQAVTMNGVTTANIHNLQDDDVAGFAGDINGLTTAAIEEGSNPFGDVQLGQDGQGLNTALETININAGEFDGDAFGFDVSSFTAWIESAAFAGGEALDLNANGVGVNVDLEVTGGDAFYETVNVHSLTDSNHVILDTNAETIATINADGDQALRICGDVLSQDTLETFDASTATGDVTAFFEGPEGGVAVTGGDGNDNFYFLVTNPDQDEGETTFTTDDTVDGGDGDNTLTLQAFEGALLGADVGANTTNIDTIVHTTKVDPCEFFGDNCFFNPMQDDLTVDMSESGSATVLDLNGAYEDHNVSVTGLENTDTVIYSGLGDPFDFFPGGDFGLEQLTLANPSPTGTINLLMAQDPCVQPFVENFFGITDPYTHQIETLIVENVLLLNIESRGEADQNVIRNADQIDTDIEVTGDVDLFLGTVPDGPPFGNDYDFDGGTINASTFEGNLTTDIGDGSQTIIGGLADDYIEDSSNNGPDLIDLSVGGSDTVEFELFFGGGNLISNDFYHLITGFSIDDDTLAIDLDASFNLQTTDGVAVAADDPLVPLVYTTNTAVDASGDPVNFIKVDTPVNTGGSSAQDGFDDAMGAGTIAVTDNGQFEFLFAYYDVTGQQMVLGFVSDLGNNTIEALDSFQVITLVEMSKADFDAFDSLTFVQ